jgi:23S rRNA (adenine1618-N6)-methyltransferase
LLISYYDIKKWDIQHIIFALLFLVERTTFIIADLLAESNNGIIPRSWVQGLDIGIGANCIYPIIGNAEYGWFRWNRYRKSY